jgi:serine protease Do
MASCRSPLARSVPAFALTFFTLALIAPARADDPPKEAVIVDKTPESVEELRALQKQVRTVLDKVLPCTVGIRAGAAQGSGVIISKDGYVLTAGHVSAQPNREVTIVFQDGKTAKAKTLGANRAIDSGLIKISEEREFPFLEMGKSGDLKRGQWCIAAGHPGGFRAGRTSPVRVGRLIEVTENYLRTDCTLVGGDSGGPLFDLEGHVVGIHSRIGGQITANIHVPIDTYRNTWDRLVKAEVWGGGGIEARAAYLGVSPDPDAEDCKLATVAEGSPAEKAGLKVGDIITKFDGVKVGTFEDLVNMVRKKKPDDEVMIEVQRDKETLKFKAKLARRPN